MRARYICAAHSVDHNGRSKPIIRAGRPGHVAPTANQIREDVRHEVFLAQRCLEWIALLSGPFTMTFVWLLAATAAETGFLILPDSAPRFSGPKGREADSRKDRGLAVTKSRRGLISQWQPLIRGGGTAM